MFQWRHYIARPNMSEAQDYLNSQMFSEGADKKQRGRLMHPHYRPTQTDATKPFAEVATLRDWFAIQAPEPREEDVNTIMRSEQAANPHNDSYKPRRRGQEEIRCALRYKFADAMLAARERRDER